MQALKPEKEEPTTKAIHENLGIRFAAVSDETYSVDDDALDLYLQAKARGLGEDEEELQDCWYSKEKAQDGLKRPRFYNKVKLGYEWTKYNQAHYDMENLPPKSIQGYKFNIFFPKLPRNSSTPQYHLENCGESDKMVVRFHAGPPYEDVYFKILNKEWEISEKLGFKSVFEQGVLHLYFNFKKHKYRR